MSTSIRNLRRNGGNRTAWARSAGRLVIDASQQRPDRSRPAATATSLSLPLLLSAPFIAEVLTPYRPNARYLKSAQIDRLGSATCPTCPPFSRCTCSQKDSLFAASGHFSIGESCYIDDTGHFNAVEFNICFNQLAYVAFAKCFAERLLSELAFLDFDDFLKCQLSSWLIVGVDGVRFSQQLNRQEFLAELTVDRATTVRGTKFFFTTIAFADADGVKSAGSVALSYRGCS